MIPEEFWEIVFADFLQILQKTYRLADYTYTR
jgi:hypothetical protein